MYNKAVMPESLSPHFLKIWYNCFFISSRYLALILITENVILFPEKLNATIHENAKETD
jgi:hypothetical protein